MNTLITYLRWYINTTIEIDIIRIATVPAAGATTAIRSLKYNRRLIFNIQKANIVLTIVNFTRSLVSLILKEKDKIYP